MHIWVKTDNQDIGFGHDEFSIPIGLQKQILSRQLFK